MILQKFKLLDGWYFLSEKPHKYEDDDPSFYYWRVYVKDGLPYALSGNLKKSVILLEIQSAKKPQPYLIDHLKDFEDRQKQTIYSLMVESGFPRYPAPNDDDIYHLDL